MFLSDEIALLTRSPALRPPGLGRLGHSERATVWGIIGLLFGGIAVLGGESNASALGLSVGVGLTLPAVLCFGWAQRAMTQGLRLLVPGVLFAGVLVLGLLSVLQPSTISRTAGQLILLGSVDRSRTFIEIVKLLALAAFVVLGFLMGSRQTRANLMLRVFLVFAGGYAAAAFISFCLAPETLMLFWNKNLFPDRLTASFLSANTAGTFFGVTTLVSVGELLRGGRSRNKRSHMPRKLVAGIAGLLALTCLLLTASRTATAATAGAVVLLSVWQALAAKRDWRSVLAVAVPIMSLIILALAVSGTAVIRRFGLIDQESVSRRDIYAAHGTLIRTHPLFGYGLGSFDPLNRQLLGTAPWDSLWSARAMHDVYLQWIEQVGLVGTMLMMLAIVALLLSGTDWLWCRTPHASAHVRAYDPTLRRIVLCASMIIIVHGLTDFALEDLAIAALFALLLGLNAGISISSSRTPARGPGWTADGNNSGSKAT